MSRPWPHPKTGVFWFRKRIPKDLLALVGKREEKASLGTKEVGEAKRRHAAHAILVDQRWENLRAGVRRLNMLEINAIAGEFYENLVPEFQAGGFSPVSNVISAAMIDGFVKDPSPGNRTQFLRFHGKEIDAHLARKGLVVDPDTRGSLEYAIAKAILQAVEQSMKYLDGDYSPDPMAGRFPKIQDKPKTVVLPLEEWFAAYAKASELAPSTQKRWLPALATLATYIGHDDLARVTPDNVADWVDDLARGGRRAKTIRDVYLASAKALFGWLKGTRKVAANPCEGLRVKVVEGPVLRDRSFTDAEASIILAAALSPQKGRLSLEHSAARRWVPWLCAYSGARVGEITQLRRKDIRHENGVPILHITPEAGTVKTKRFRYVPIHPHLIEMGFLDYVSTRPGPLFYDPARGRGGSDANPISKKVGERLAAWVRKLGITDVGVDPNHGWRHAFKTRGRRGGMRDSVLDAIQGHVPQTEGGKYGEFPADVMANEMKLFPRYADRPTVHEAVAA
ncbi:tyrosine-type recombinase/integrase [Methylobacterium sp. BTF04]|uniref:site-specific integrase n=1 Tax=Methylobacterium sp. BTF04 TaxID=2708300 RepID=UPI0013D3D0A6|nr:site-specific integrase [Methylobacterium sp. BTF04]NEU13694.1 tyrosine-type recombinase/integrase [Methylobacterium sp. BTF04]